MGPDTVRGGTDHRNQELREGSSALRVFHADRVARLSTISSRSTWRFVLAGLFPIAMVQTGTFGAASRSAGGGHRQGSGRKQKASVRDPERAHEHRSAKDVGRLRVKHRLDKNSRRKGSRRKTNRLDT